MSLQPPERAERAEPQLPAPAPETTLAVVDEPRPAAGEWRQPVGVSLLPLAIVTFLVIAFTMALWTFLAATG